MKSTYYIGSYTEDDDLGIHRIAIDSESGEITAEKSYKSGVNPSFLAKHPNKDIVYAINEICQYDNQELGSISQFKLDRETGDLILTEDKSSGGAGPCHFTTSPEGKYIFVANYTEGSTALLLVDSEGNVGDPLDCVQHTGSGPNVDRQESPHIHCVTPDNKGHYYFVADLGSDEVTTYKIEEDELIKASVFKCVPGSGPRYIAVRENYCYLIHEFSNTISVLHLGSDGKLSEVQSVSTLPKGFKGVSYASHMEFSSDGNYLYASNRGYNTIVRYKVAENLLTSPDWTSSGGEWPRHFHLTADGQFLIAANQENSTITTLKVNPLNGKLSPTGKSCSLHMPTCVLEV